MDQEEDVDEETAEFIPIDSIELTGDEEEDAADQEDEEQLLSSPLTSPKRSESVAQKQAKKTSITPILSKWTFLSYTGQFFFANDYSGTDKFWIGLSFAEKKTPEKAEQQSEDEVSWKTNLDDYIFQTTWNFTCQ